MSNSSTTTTPAVDRKSLWRAMTGVTLGASLAFAFLALRPDLMMVERVVFEGGVRTEYAALRHLADIRNGVTIFEVDLERAERGVEAHPWVAAASARRVFPATVVIEVEEHVPVALLQDETLWYVDRSGHPFLAARSNELDYPVITGVDADLRRAHPHLPALATRDALDLLDALDSRGLVASEDVSEIAFSRHRGFTVNLESGSRLLFGLDDQERQVSRLSRLVEEGLDLAAPVHVDLAPRTVAIVRPLGRPAEG